MESFENVSINDEEFKIKCSSLSRDISQGRCLFLQLIESLEALLTHETFSEREKGIVIISSILKEISECLTQAEFSVLCHFFINRLRDHHEILPSLIKGFKIMIETNKLPNGMAEKMLTSMFQHISCQQQQQSDRLNIYIIFRDLLENREQELKSMGLNLVLGVISFIDQERDPRNLKFLFNWLPVFLQKIQLGNLTVEMFECLSCYFPVDFTPSSGETITRDMLATALSHCLCSVPEFGKYAIPLASEKLNSDILTAKLDSLDILINGCSTFPLREYLQHSSEIWFSIRKEILNSTNETLTSKCLIALMNFVNKISEAEDSKEMITNMIDNVKKNLTLNNSERVLDENSCKMILRIAMGSNTSSEIVIKSIAPLLINLFNITSNTIQRGLILNMLCDLCIIYIERNPNGYECKWVDDISVVPNLCFKAICDPDVNMIITGYKNFLKIAYLIPNEPRGLLYENLKKIIILEIPDNLRQTVLACFQCYADIYPEEIENLLRSLNVNGYTSLKLYLEAIATTVSSEKLGSFALIEITDHVFKKSKDKESALTALKVLESILVKELRHVEEYLMEVVMFPERFIDWYNNLRDAESDVALYEGVSTVLLRTVAKLNDDRQKNILQLISYRMEVTERTLPVWYGALVGLKKNPARFYVNGAFFEKLLNLGFDTENCYLNRKSSELIGNLLNKMDDEEYLDEILNDADLRVESYLADDKNVKNVVNVLTFITKGLVLRGYKNSFFWTNKLLQLSCTHNEAIDSFEIILNETYLAFTDFCYVKQRLLYKQKFFLEVVNFISEQFKIGDRNLLMIVAYVVTSIPKQLLFMNFSKVIKWIILYLSECDDVKLTYNLLEVVNGVIARKDGIVDGCIGDLLKCYQDLSSNNSYMKIRILALQGIALLANYPPYLTIPYRQDLLVTLGRCVDDKKRLVRKEAVEARLKWYLLDSPM